MAPDFAKWTPGLWCSETWYNAELQLLDNNFILKQTKFNLDLDTDYFYLPWHKIILYICIGIKIN